ncbi:hypothetical protein AVEN_34624-1 [Araneus ventricosus]|uniref:Uncharacterized protein n=1 Tax=Araneus ventricosus TaxID=182803 RepID=A0A4Y2AZC6_ARAVE|nr:hypothetical protein AVEN_34624-1 [Araneus ventricosus]
MPSGWQLAVFFHARNLCGPLSSGSSPGRQPILPPYWIYSQNLLQGIPKCPKVAFINNNCHTSFLSCDHDSSTWLIMLEQVGLVRTVRNPMQSYETRRLKVKWQSPNFRQQAECLESTRTCGIIMYNNTTCITLHVAITYIGEANMHAPYLREYMNLEDISFFTGGTDAVPEDLARGWYICVTTKSLGFLGN